jgi:hypothetical protein
MQWEQGDISFIIWYGHLGEGLALVEADALIIGLG